MPTKFRFMVAIVVFSIALILPQRGGILGITSQQEPILSKDVLVEVTDGIAQIEIPAKFTAYAFAWNHPFTFSLNNEVYSLPREFEDEGIEIDSPYNHYSDLYFKGSNEEVLYLRSSVQQAIRLTMINPSDSGPVGEVLGASTSSPTGQVNLTSGANYSELSIISRPMWGADESISTWKPQYYKANRFVIHHTAWTNNPNDYASTVRAIHIYHAVTHGWGDIGYNFLIDPNGQIYEGRKGGAEVIGAHAGGDNDGSIGIAMMGTFTSQGPTTAALESLKKLLAERSLLHGISLEWQVSAYGHRDSPYSNTQCPGDYLESTLGTIVQSAEQMRQAGLTGTIATQRATSLSTLSAYTGAALKLTFTQEALQAAPVSQLIPKYSGILKVLATDATSATIAVESYPYYGGYRDDTANRVLTLHEIFSLDPRVESVELVTIPQVVEYTPLHGEEKDIELATPSIYFSHDVTKGTGNIQILNAGDNSVLASFDASSSNVTKINSHRYRIYLPEGTTFSEGQGYKVDVCATCFKTIAGESYNAVPASQWEFAIAVTRFKPIYRFWSDRYLGHFYTISPNERDKVINNYSDSIWKYEGPVFYALTVDKCFKGTPVYRFWSDKLQAHFYTADRGERDRVTERYPTIWRLEGRVFCAYDYQKEGTKPVFRFWSDIFQNHFYTASKSEKDKVIRDYPKEWRYEGQVFFVPLSETI